MNVLSVPVEKDGCIYDRVKHERWNDGAFLQK